MPRFISFIFALCALTSSSVAVASGPQGNPAGVGIILGEPSGLSAKYWFNPAHAVDLHLSFDFSDDAFAVVSNYLLHFNVFQLDSQSIDLPVYVGGGGKFSWRDSQRQNDDQISLGARIPAGLSLILLQAPLEFFAEVALGFKILPSTSGDIDGGLGVRYYF